MSASFSSFRRIAILALLGLGVIAEWVVGCSDTAYIYGECDAYEDCHKFPNNIPGTLCLDNSCECLPGSNQEKCCPFGDWANCKKDGDYACRNRGECSPEPPLVLTPVECKKDADCAGPPNPQCGSPFCERGRCHLGVQVPSPPTASQKPGDCMATYCDTAGNVFAQQDPSDVPKDGGPCTLDLCNGSSPAPVSFPDGARCPETDRGVCFQGNCVECIGNIDCDNPSAPACDNSVCVPWSCIDGMKNGTESYTDCGGEECKRCETDEACKVADDCRSRVCLEGKCQSATHSDEVKNDSETGIDCGCTDCDKKCQAGEGCKQAEDCLSNVCYIGECQKPTCTDGTQNQGEKGPDCGGPCALSCPGQK